MYSPFTHPVGEKAVSTVPEAVDSFSILLQQFTFFSGFPRRWEILNTQGNLDFILKSLSVARWCAHNGYTGVLQTLKHIFEYSE